MTQRRVAITGIGLITAYGVGEERFWTGLMGGESAIRKPDVELFDFPTTHYGVMPPIDFDEYLDPQASAFWSLATKSAVTAGRFAVRDAGAEPKSFAGPKTGVLLGTGYGCVYEFEELFDTYFKRGWKRLKPITVPKLMPNAPASRLAIEFGARGMNATISTACSSGAIACGLAASHIRSGALDACIAGGVDFIGNSATLAVWNALRVLSRRNDETAARPFSVDRDGLVFGDGCAVFILEEWERAKARGARIRAELAGVGTTNDAVNIVGPDPVGESEAIAMALEDAGIGPESIDYINAHGTSTDANDANETAVIRQCFGDRAPKIPVSSIKGHIGHAMGAAGAIELAATTLALEHQRIPPTLNYAPGDERCDLDYVPEGPRDAEMEYAMTNSFGFGGQNSVLVLRKAPILQ
ncbi:MAG: beta-ketoacyl-[acyl-carrier-protein] synthase family protein [Planctomycetota bacterium]